jgi:hypothetical protein
MAITTFTGDLSAQFAAGTSLEARPASNWPAAKRPPEAGTTPVGSAAATAASNSAGVLSLAGLADSTEYYVSDAAGTRYVRITTFPERQELVRADVGTTVAELDSHGYVPSTEEIPTVLNANDPLYSTPQGVIDQAVSLIAATGQPARVLFPPGIYTPSGSGGAYYTLPKSLANWLILDGYGAQINLTTGVPRFLDVNRTADLDTFQNVAVRGFRLNFAGTGTTGRHHCLIGNFQAGTSQRRLNWQDMVFKDIECVGIPTNTGTGDITNGSPTVLNASGSWAIGNNISGAGIPAATTVTNVVGTTLTMSANATATATGVTITDSLAYRFGVLLASTQQATGETVTNIRRIRFENVKLNGSMNGFCIYGNTAGAGGAGYTQFIDEIDVVDCYHDTGVTNVASPGGGLNLHIGNEAQVGTVRVSNFIGKGSGDVGIELNSFDDALVDNARIEECVGYSYYFTNYNNPPNPNRQVVRYRNCVQKTALGGRMFRFNQNRSITLGHAVIDRPNYFRSTSEIGAQNEFVGCSAGMKQLDIIDAHVVVEGVSYTGTGTSQSQAMIEVPNGADGYPSVLRIVRPFFRYKATAATGGANVPPSTNLIYLVGGTSALPMQWDIIDPTLSLDLTGWGGVEWDAFCIGLAGSSYMTGKLRGFRSLPQNPATTVNLTALKFGTTGTLQPSAHLSPQGQPAWMIEDCDFASNFASSVAPVRVGSNALKAYIMLDHCVTRGSVTPIVNEPAAITPGASPYSYQNLDMLRERVFVQGGTVSKVELTQGSSTVDTGVVAGEFTLDVGDVLKVTYTVAPTMTKFVAR